MDSTTLITMPEELAQQVRENNHLLKRLLAKLERVDAQATKDRLDAKDAAKYLGVSTSTLRRYVKEGKLSDIKFGRRVQFSRSALDRFIKNNTRGPKEEGIA